MSVGAKQHDEHYDVEHYVNMCAGCQRNKTSTQKPAGLLQPLPVPSRKWGSVSMDSMTALPEIASGNSVIVVFVDRLSKVTHLAARKTSIGTQAFAKLFRHEVIRLHGLRMSLSVTVMVASLANA